MILGKISSDKIIEVALSYLDHPWSRTEFNCVTFVREVYARVGIEIPKLRHDCIPSEFNITKDQFENPPAGHLIFLLDPNDPRKERAWTHLVISLGDQKCIHCSLFFGRKVVISTIEEIRKKYLFAESKTAPN